MDIAASYTQPDQLVSTVKRMTLPDQRRRLGGGPCEGRRGFVPANAVVAPGASAARQEQELDEFPEAKRDQN